MHSETRKTLCRRSNMFSLINLAEGQDSLASVQSFQDQRYHSTNNWNMVPSLPWVTSDFLLTLFRTTSWSWSISSTDDGSRCQSIFCLSMAVSNPKYNHTRVTIISLFFFSSLWEEIELSRRDRYSGNSFQNLPVCALMSWERENGPRTSFNRLYSN